VALHLRKAESLGEDLPIAIALGNDPVMTIAAGMPMGYDQSEYEMAGALRGAPSPVPGSWDVLQCGRTRRDAYPQEFRMTPADIDNAPEVPAIPPLETR
jgi:hypothetical protein